MRSENGLLGNLARIFCIWLRHIGKVTVLLSCMVALPKAVQAEPAAELYAAAAAGQLERVDTLLSQGADANAKNPADRTPLHAASAAGNARVVRKLLAFGADPNLTDKRGITALMEAVSHGFEEVAKDLIAAGADVNAKDTTGATLIDKARKNGQGRLAALLEKSGAKPPEPAKPTEGEGEKKADEAKTEEEKPAEDGAKPADSK
jgi:ankyrin repeat protein